MYIGIVGFIVEGLPHESAAICFKIGSMNNGEAALVKVGAGGKVGGVVGGVVQEKNGVHHVKAGG